MHLDGHGLDLHGAARDLVTNATGPTVVGDATVRALVDAHGTLADLTIDPDVAATAPLIGLPVAGGFRDAVAAALSDDHATGSPLALLLDDLPVAALISGYARLYAGDIPANAARTGMQSDICSGWRSEGTMMISVRAGGGVPVTVGPAAPATVDERVDDEDGWHHIEPLREGSMRRRRLIDIHPDDGRWQVRAMFRDTHVQPGGSETVLHEYDLSATVDVGTGHFVTCSAVPRVLPWVECPVAAASADRLIGKHVDTTRDYVRSDLRGVSTCTHLNDLLRSLGDIGALTRMLSQTPTAPERT